jgi:uncharacterized protein (DUF779 family)
MIEATNQVHIPEQVVRTPRAAELMKKLAATYGPIVFLQSGGCCGGASPMCYPQRGFQADESDHLLGTLDGAPFYSSEDQFAYWKHSQIIVDVAPGMGGIGSLENSEGVRFLIRSRVFTNEEIAALRAAGKI